LKILSSILYLEFNDLVELGIAESTIKDGCAQKRPQWIKIKDPSCRSKALIKYETLADKYKALITTKYGNPYIYLANSIIEQHLISRTEDIDFILNYRLSDGSQLPDKHKTDYINACKFLYFLSNHDTKSIKSIGFKSMQVFNDAVISIIRANNVALPTAYVKLKEKVRIYREIGAEAVISKKFCNVNSQKLGELQITLLKQLYARPNNFGIEKCTRDYNGLAKKQGWKEITPKCAGLHLNNGATLLQIDGMRHGVQYWRDKHDLVVHRDRPSVPLLLVVGDGTPFELYYQAEMINKNNHKITKHWLRKNVYVVIDAFNELILGYAIGETESNDLTRLAWKNAVLSTGYMPWQIKTDRFGLKDLKVTTFDKLAPHVTPSAVGNARDKVIESMFNRVNEAVFKEYSNFAGPGITALKKHHANRDYLDKTKNSFPDESSLIAQIDEAINKWNSLSHKVSTVSRQQQWLDAFAIMPEAQKRPLTDDLRLEIFGTTHKYTNTLTNKGLQVTINGTTRNYMLLDHNFYETIGTEYTIKYDENDLSQVMAISACGRFKFTVPELAKSKMALKDMTEGDRTHLNKLLNFKKETIDRQVAKNIADMDMLEAEGYRKQMFTGIKGTNKELIYASQNVLKGRTAPIETESDTMFDEPFTDQSDANLKTVPFNVFDL
jgi:hypothetical protein